MKYEPAYVSVPCCHWLELLSALTGLHDQSQDTSSPCFPVVCRVGVLACWSSDERNSLKLNKESLTKAERMEKTMNMQGLLAVLEEDKDDLVGRRETHFAPVPLTGVQLEVLEVFTIMSLFMISLSAPPGTLYSMAQLISSNNYHMTDPQTSLFQICLR